jgi:hypothetical protein
LRLLLGEPVVEELVGDTAEGGATEKKGMADDRLSVLILVWFSAMPVARL